MSGQPPMSPALYVHLADRIPKAAREANRRFPLVSQDDFEQEMWLRALASSERFARLLAEDKPELIWHELKRAGHRYGMQDDRDRRARKAAAEGYNTYDELFYTPQMLGHLLSELIESEWDLPFAMDRATKGLDLTGVRVQAGGDTHDSFMDYLALLTDVKAAFERLSQYQQDILTTWFSEGTDEEAAKWDREAIAGSMGITYDALRFRKDRAVKALIRELGGESPYIRRRPGESEAGNA